VELELTTDQDFFQETTRKFLEAEASPTALRELRDDPTGYDSAYWRQGCELGWTSLLVSEDDGGGSISDSGLGDLALVAHEFGRHAAPGPLLPTNIVAAALSRSGSDDQKAKTLAGIISGDVIASWAFAEAAPDQGLGTITTSATKSGSGYVLSGVKQPVEAGGQADVLLVTAKDGDGITQFLVPTDAPGVTITPMRTIELTNRFASVKLDNVEVPADAVVGTAGGAAADVERQLELALIIQAHESVGAMEKALEITIEWAFNRYSFGRPLASYQELKHRFADMKTWLEASHALADAATRAVQDERDDANEIVSSAKAYISMVGPELCQDCVQMHGGIGVTFDHDMHLYLRRVTLGAGLYGTVTEHRLRVTDILESKGA
jgi:alkylation response protein AidB-like acyl-CoA dehydrogenase